MTPNPRLRPVSGLEHLSAQLVDEIAEMLVNPETRPAAICGLVAAIYETVEWVHGAGSPDDELASLRRVVAEAQRHSERMAATQSRIVA